MKLFVIDTNTFTLFQRGHPRVCQRVAATAPSERALSAISIDEILSGWFTRVRQARTRDQLAEAYRNLTDSAELLREFRLLTFSEPAIVRFEGLVRLRLNIGNNDLRIAATALEHGATVVTQNLRDFRRVPGLACEDWSV